MVRVQNFQLSDRLQTIASHISEGESVADIGTDHGYIPIWLLSRGITDKVILTDINKGPLEKALGNFRKWMPAFTPELRQGSGLSVLKPGEADDIIIAGMGGILIGRILEAHPEVVNSADRLILQPRNHSFTLRNQLRRLQGFVITDEEIALESGKNCEIITLTRRKAASDSELRRAEQIQELEARLGLEERIYDEVPVMYALYSDRRYHDYLELKSRAEIRVIESILSHGRSDYADSRRHRAEERLRAFRKIKELQERLVAKQDDQNRKSAGSDPCGGAGKSPGILG